MNCNYCKHLNHAFGNYWCVKGLINSGLGNFDPITSYSCPFFENALTYTITTTTGDILMEQLKEIVKDQSKDINSELVVKSSRLAESILMDWNKEEQIELAKEVAILTHNIIIKK